jgi:hypothetical protein
VHFNGILHHGAISSLFKVQRFRVQRFRGLGYLLLDAGTDSAKFAAVRPPVE